MQDTGDKVRYKIAVDAMGGDYAPAEIIKGAFQAADKLGVEIILVGLKSSIEAELVKQNVNRPVTIIDAPDMIKDGEEPAYAVMRKKNNSIAVATKLVKEGKADAVVSAGNTGAVMVCALQYLGTLPGIERPIAGGTFCGLSPETMIMDLGANVGVKPLHLLNFAVAGSIYMQSLHGIENPTVAILSVGAEEGKGNEVTKEAYTLLKNSNLNFIGNVEGMDIPLGKANVIVCDGFVGNVIVKFAEGLGHVLSRWLNREMKDELPAEKLAVYGQKLYEILSPAVAMGGGPLIGVNGIAAIGHGASNAAQIVATIKNAHTALESGFVDILREELQKMQKGAKDAY